MIVESRQLALKGKVIIVNALPLFPLLHLASILHIPINVIEEA